MVKNFMFCGVSEEVKIKHNFQSDCWIKHEFWQKILENLFPIRLKSHDDRRMGRPSNKTRKLLRGIVFIYIVVFGFIFLLSLGILI
jgi:hypothetical protein